MPRDQLPDSKSTSVRTHGRFVKCVEGVLGRLAITTYRHPMATIALLVALCVVAGFAVQLYFMKALYGAPLLFVGICLLLVKGYDSRLRIKGFTQDPNWKTVSIEKIQGIEQLRKKNKKWDRDALDLSSWLGVFSLILIG